MAKQYLAVSVHREFSAVYVPSVMSERVVHEWECGGTNIRDDERSGH